MADKIQIQVSADTKQASQAFSNFGAKIITANQGLQLFKDSVSALTAPLNAVVEEGRNFTQQMANIRAVSNLTEKEFEKLTNTAREIGKTTSFSAVEAGKGMEALIKAGFDVNKTLETIPEVMNLAAASGVELGSVADTVAVQLGLFEDSGLSARDAVDLMTKTANASAQNFGHLQEALKNSAQTAAAFGIDFDNLTVILGAMADAGVRGERAGTALNGALARLANPTKQITDKLDELGVSIDQVDPKTNDFKDILDTLKDSGADASDILEILGQEAGPKFAKLVLEGSEALVEFEKKQNAANDAATTATEKLDSLAGKQRLLSSALSGLAEALSQSLNPLIEDLVDVTIVAVNKFTDFVTTGGGLKTTIDSLRGSLRTITNFFGLTSTESEKFAGAMDDANEASATLDHTLTGNTVSESLKAVADFFGIASIEASGFGKSMADANAESEKVDSTLARISTLTSGLKDVSLAFGGGLATGAAGQVGLGAVAAGIESGDISGGIASGVADLVLSNESVKEALGEVAEALAELVKPIAESLVPILEEIAPLLEELAPVFELLGNIIGVLIDVIKGGLIVALTTGFAAVIAPLILALVAVSLALAPLVVVGAAIVGLAKILKPIVQQIPEIAANIFNALESGFKFFLNIIKTILAPVFNFFKNILNNVLKPLFDGFASAFKFILNTVLLPIFNAFKSIIENNLNRVFGFFKNTVQLVGTVLNESFNFFQRIINMVFRPIINFLNDIFNNFNNNVFGGIQTIFNNLVNGLNGAFDWFQRIIIGPLNGVVDWFQRIIIGPLQNVINNLTGGGSSNNFGIPKLFHNGSNGPLTQNDLLRLPGMSQDEGLAVLQTGEQVIPRDGNSNGNGVNITFNVRAINPREQTEEIRQLIEELSLAGRLRLAA